MEGHQPALHIWPSKWGLPSFEPLCLAAVLHLQLTFRGKYSILECTSSESSPTGTLPTLVHKTRKIAPLSALLKYDFVTKEQNELGPLNMSLSSAERSQSTAWCSHVETNLGDLVAHMLFAQDANWREMTYPALVEMYSIPQRYYAPGRFRNSYKPRLEAAELWVNIGEEINAKESSFRPTEKPEKNANHHDRFLRVFEREKVLEKARSILEMYARLLGQQTFFYGDRLTNLDVLVAAHILIMIRPNYPDNLISELTKSSFPLLVNHAERVYSEAFPEGQSLVPTSQQTFSLTSLLPRLF